MDLDSVADELYGLPPSEFTAQRNARAKQARADGHRELASGIQDLAKPSTSAWLVNQLARRLGADLEPLIELGRDLREASSNVSGDELRALTRQRHEVVNALVQQARSLAAKDGLRVSESIATEVRQTLDASLADSAVAEAVLSGRLTRPAEYAGFGEPVGIAWQGTAGRRTNERKHTARAGSTAEVADLDARRRAAARRALDETVTRLERAQSDRRTAERDSEQAASALQSAEREVAQLRGLLEAAQRQATAARRADRTARESLDRAVHRTQRAEHARDEAAAKLEALEE
ncbi:MAG: hypothetical protein ACRDOY_04520 [Nocardioidaceae bacterium]